MPSAHASSPPERPPRPLPPLRAAAVVAASAVVIGGTVLLLVPGGGGPPPATLAGAGHSHGSSPVAAPSAAPSEEAAAPSADNSAIPRLQFDPVALTTALADAVAHDPTASQAPSADTAARVGEPHLLYRGFDEDDRVTAGLTACVAESGEAALQLQYDLREDAGTWVVERRSGAGTAC